MTKLSEKNEKMVLGDEYSDMFNDFVREYEKLKDRYLVEEYSLLEKYGLIREKDAEK